MDLLALTKSYDDKKPVYTMLDRKNFDAIQKILDSKVALDPKAFAYSEQKFANSDFAYTM